VVDVSVFTISLLGELHKAVAGVVVVMLEASEEDIVDADDNDSDADTDDGDDDNDGDDDGIPVCLAFANGVTYGGGVIVII
jgi:hypothetical protein